MSSAVQFPYLNAAPAMGNAGWVPLLPIALRNGPSEVTELALVDSGAAVSILPYDLGVRPGFDWNQIPGSVSLAGVLVGYANKLVVLDATVGPFGPLQLGFAWTQAPGVRLLLGQTNFFMLFDVCFFRTRLLFQIEPATP